MLLDIELLEHNDYLPKKDSMFGSVQAFPMYGGLGMSTPSLHRESSASLMIFTLVSLILRDRRGRARARALLTLTTCIHSACAKHKMATKTSGNAGRAFSFAI